MSKIRDTFEELKCEGRCALIPFIMGGDPSLEVTGQLIKVAEANGANILEIGIPFSDPMADGPVLQKAAQRSLAQGVRIRDLFRVVKESREETDIPIVFLAYYNSVYNYGQEAFVEAAASSGVDGLIVPDLPVEEADGLRKLASDAGVDLIFLVAPTSTHERLNLISERSMGFIYCVSLKGITGSRSSLDTGLQEFIGRVRRQTDMPLAVGFGISNAQMACQVGKIADGAIIGSALVELMEASSTTDAALYKAAEFIKEVREALDLS
jgi:tryptophan synthase alpha chain